MLLVASEPSVSNPNPAWLTLPFVVGLILIHLYAGKLELLAHLPRSRCLSAAGGVSVAYVFVHLLPDLSERQAAIAQTGILTVLEHHIYLLALLGLTVFYGLEWAVQTSQQRQREAGKSDTPALGVFWIHILSFAAFNGLIGYLLVHREEPGLASLCFYFIAIGLHFLVNDYGLRQDHRHTYHQIGRWILAGAIATGWAIGVGTEIPEAGIAILFAFLSGGIILNTLKEELPAERQSRFWAFLTGAFIYTVVLLAL